MVTFYPGPSQLAPHLDVWMAEAYSSGILASNHRSEPFMKLFHVTCETVRDKLHVPAEYQVLFTSSATECWEIITQSFTGLKHHHYFSGAFGAKWHDYASRLHPDHVAHEFSMNEKPAPVHHTSSPVVLSFTQNETANGTLIPIEYAWKVLNPEALVTVDATSSMGGTDAPVAHGDIWFASVQKCFGLPSGMAVMIISPKAVSMAREINERKHYNSLSFILDNAKKNQTPYTPNILGIYLLNKVLSNRPAIDQVARDLENRMKQLSSVIDKKTDIQHYINNAEMRSPTVCTLQATASKVEKIKTLAIENGMILGNGYGQLRESTFRIANFPAIQPGDWIKLLSFLEKTLN